MNKLKPSAKPLARERSAWIKPIIVMAFVGLILSATVAAYMGWLPLTPATT